MWPRESKLGVHLILALQKLGVWCHFTVIEQKSWPTQICAQLLLQWRQQQDVFFFGARSSKTVVSIFCGLGVHQTSPATENAINLGFVVISVRFRALSVVSYIHVIDAENDVSKFLFGFSETCIYIYTYIEAVQLLPGPSLAFSGVIVCAK